MKNLNRLMLMVAVGTLSLACNESGEKKSESQEVAEVTSKKEIDKSKIPSGDYSTLFASYQCDMDLAETARVLDVPAGDLNLSEYQKPNFCSYDLMGYGKNRLGDPTTILWEVVPSTKEQNRSEIEVALKNQEEYPDGVIQGMGIVLAETGDAYIYRQPHIGRVLAFNEHYDNMLLISYGVQNKVMTDRTGEQHELLTSKMVDLANYLLKKHRK